MNLKVPGTVLVRLGIQQKVLVPCFAVSELIRKFFWRGWCCVWRLIRERRLLPRLGDNLDGGEDGEAYGS